MFQLQDTTSATPYIARKKYTGDALYECFSEIRELVNVSSVNEVEVDSAIKLRSKDFEDALQYYSAKSVKADYIITRNTKDFSYSDIKVLTPREFTSLYL